VVNHSASIIRRQAAENQLCASPRSHVFAERQDCRG
jgi:hypothetical protein